MKGVVSGIILTLLLLTSISFVTEPSREDVSSLSNQTTASIASDYENVTTHEGDLIIDGTQTYVIENCMYVQTGSIYVRDWAKLIVRNSEIQMNQTYFTQYESKVEDHSILELEDAVFRSDHTFYLELLQYSKASFRNVTLHTSTVPRGENMGIAIGDYSEVSIYQLTPENSWIQLSGHCNVSIENSKIFGMKISEETCKIRLSASRIDHSLWLEFSRGSVVDIDNLKPGFHEYLDLKEKASVYGMPIDVTINKTFVNSWSVSAYYDSETVISNSVLGGFGMWISGLFVHFENLKPGFHEYFRVGKITLNKTELNFIEVTILGKSDVTITNSSIDILHVFSGNSDVSVTNSTLISLKAGGFLGSLYFEETTLKIFEVMAHSDFSIYGNVNLEEVGEVWLSCSVTRNYDIIVKDRYDEPTISDASLILKSKDVVIWNGTTDNQGVSNFNLTFADGNYTDTLKLEAVRANWSSSQNLTFLSGTPIVFSSPFPPPPVASFGYTPEKPWANEQIMFNASESYSPRGNINAYEWNFDENITTIAEHAISHTYAIPGNHTVTLKVWDNNTSWHTTSRMITVFYSTDLNKDGVINILDISIVAVAYNSRPGDPKWNELADLDKNEIINILDISMIAKDYGKTV